MTAENVQTAKKEYFAHHRSTKTSKIIKGMALNMLKHTFLVFRVYFEKLIDFLFSLYWGGSRQALPDLEKRHAVLAESACTLAAKIKNKEITSEELVTLCIERIKAVNPILNAVTDERFEDALKDAREIDKAIKDGDEEILKKPFLGVPFTAKESHAVHGMLHTLGLAARRHARATADAECVRLLRDAGAIPVAVTNVPEVNKWQETRNMIFGQTNNPYHAGRTVGGSSGGEAALCAALASPISLCSDIGGSTRMPAFYCGLFGMNPTAGHTSLKGSALRSGLDPTMASIGFISRHCGDLAPLLDVVAAEKAPLLDLHRPVDVKNLKYYYVETAKDLRVSPISPDLRKAMKRVVEHLRAEVGGDRTPRRYWHGGLSHMLALWRHGMAREADCFPRLLTNNQGEASGLLELAKKLIGYSAYTLAAIMKLLDEQVLPPVDPQWADRLTKELADDLSKVLGSDGVLLFPSAPAAAPYHYSLLLRPFNFAYWGVFNAIKFPAAQVPLGLNEDGLPIGIQVVAAPRQDALCLAVAEHLGKAFGGFVPPCRLGE